MSPCVISLQSINKIYVSPTIVNESDMFVVYVDVCSVFVLCYSASIGLELATGNRRTC